MKKFVKILSLTVAILMTTSLFACSKRDTTAQFRVGMECAYAPFNWTQSDNKNGAVAIEGGGFASGYDVEIAKKVAEGLGRELVIVKTEWDGLEPALNSGTIDAIIAGMSPTADRKTRIDFSDAYYTSDLVVVVKKNGPYASAKTLKDFKDAKITAQLNTFHYTVIDQLEGAKKEVALTDFPVMITALSSGVIDGYISERPGAVSAMASNSELTFISFAEGEGFVASEEDVAIAVGLKKGNTIAEDINKVLSGISTKERTEIMDNALKTQPVVAE